LFTSVLKVVFEQAMHQGVVRDMEQQRLKRERQLDFDMQKALEEEYKKGQTVRDSTADMENTRGGGG
jgi:protein PET117